MTIDLGLHMSSGVYGMDEGERSAPWEVNIGTRHGS